MFSRASICPTPDCPPGVTQGEFGHERELTMAKLSDTKRDRTRTDDAKRASRTRKAMRRAKSAALFIAWAFGPAELAR